MASLTSIGTASPTGLAMPVPPPPLSSAPPPAQSRMPNSVMAPAPSRVVLTMPQAPQSVAPEASVTRSASAPYISQKVQVPVSEAPGWCLDDPHASHISGVLRECYDRLANTRREMNEVIAQRNALYRSLQQAENDFQRSTHDWNKVQEELSTVRRALSVGINERGRDRIDRLSQDCPRGRSPGAGGRGFLSPSSHSTSPLWPRAEHAREPAAEEDCVREGEAIDLSGAATSSSAVMIPQILALPDSAQLPSGSQVKRGAVDEQEQRASMTAEATFGRMEAFMVDNSQLGARTRGLGLRLSPRHDHIDEETPPLQWGSIVYATAISQDWAKVQNRFLPMQLDGVPVLTPLSLCDAEGNGSVLATCTGRGEPGAQMGVAVDTMALDTFCAAPPPVAEPAASEADGGANEEVVSISAGPPAADSSCTALVPGCTKVATEKPEGCLENHEKVLVCRAVASVDEIGQPRQASISMGEVRSERSSRGSVEQLLAESARVRLNSRKILGIADEEEDLKSNTSAAFSTRALEMGSISGTLAGRLEERRCSKQEAASRYINSLVTSTLQRLEVDNDVQEMLT